MGPHDRKADKVIARIASGAQGIVTHAELLAARITAKEIRTRLKRGSLLPQFRGVYRVGHAAPSTEAAYMAAVKACGKGAVLSGRAAAYLWGLIRGAPPPAEVTAATEKNVEGLRTRCRRLHRGDTTTCRQIPITSVARTIVDLAAVLSEDDLARAVHDNPGADRGGPSPESEHQGRPRAASRAGRRGARHAQLPRACVP
jgi:predicted transcriptional regulator of viral defense system